MKRLALLSPLLLVACDQLLPEAEEPQEQVQLSEVRYKVSELRGDELNAMLAGTSDDGLRVVFASPAEGAAVLTAEDEYTAEVQAREAGIRAQDASVTTFQGYAPLYEEDVQEWTDEEKDALREAVAAHQDVLDLLDGLLPDPVLLVKTGSVVEGGLPHTRANAIIFAGGTIPSGDGLQSLYLHELHHVLSRANTDVHDAYYGLIGYRPCEVEEPEGLRAVRLSNPDAPVYDHYVPVDIVGADGVLPYLYATRDYDGEGVLGNYFGLGLLPVSVENGTCSTVVEGPEGLIPPQDVPEFLQTLGGNTGYIIHPEETASDNFVFWAMEREGLPTPDLPKKIGAFWEAQAAGE
ncbi:hypothetical protein HK107_00425 [Parvularcula sp. ZS-1/3]|uniref:Uncharacterized protein n=1 Tax=Parvularcula mediterranea TaxID=2732508 RepID=A0A7Y3RIM0_9PROT|nr:hypothetical protein [Parvularcula mediterranea]NNU14785.1 hypothetical protein [Parvularcula mediterranea]